jgi:hypothetical protein
MGWWKDNETGEGWAQHDMELGDRAGTALAMEASARDSYTLDEDTGHMEHLLENRFEGSQW